MAQWIELHKKDTGIAESVNLENACRVWNYDGFLHIMYPDGLVVQYREKYADVARGLVLAA